MKSFFKSMIGLAVLLSFSVPALAAQESKNTSIEVGSTLRGYDLTNEGRYMGIDPYINAQYTIKFGKQKCLKIGANTDVNMLFNDGTKTDVTISPTANLQYGNIGFSTSFSQQFFCQEGKSNIAVSAENKGVRYWIKNYYAVEKGTSSFFSSNYSKFSYKIKAGKKFAIIPFVETDEIFYPTAAFTDVKAGTGLSYGPVCANVKLSTYFLPKKDTSLNTSTYFYIDPVVGFNLTQFGIKGISIKVAGSFPVTSDLTGISLVPQIVYKNGGISVLAAFRVGNIDVAPKFNPFLKCSYTFKL